MTLSQLLKGSALSALAVTLSFTIIPAEEAEAAELLPAVSTASEIQIAPTAQLQDRSSRRQARQSTRSSNRSARQSTRSSNRQNRQSTRSTNRQNRQSTRSENRQNRQSTRSENRQNSQSTRSENRQNRQSNRGGVQGTQRANRETGQRTQQVNNGQQTRQVTQRQGTRNVERTRTRRGANINNVRAQTRSVGRSDRRADRRADRRIDRRSDRRFDNRVNRRSDFRSGRRGVSNRGVYNGRFKRWDRFGWRKSSRYNWYNYRRSNRGIFRLGRYYSPYRNYGYSRFSVGFYLDSLFFSSRYWINDPWSYRLPSVYGPYRWVRYYDDVALVNIYTGEVVDVIHNFFY